ncbi:MAG: holo-ACP synthase [Gammaproteobacteria bacterium]|nr:holo-ACP synthase [Gammaproteobacteria bacterium]
MAIIGLGTDIVEIQRVEKAFSPRFAERVLTESELNILKSSKEPARYLAKRWSAKEAAAKALGTGIGRGISFQQFEISNDELGAPVLELNGAAFELSQQKGIKSIHLSISDEQHYAVATVIYS